MIDKVRVRGWLRRVIPEGVRRVIRSVSFSRTDRDTTRFIAHNRRIWQDWNQSETNSVVLFDDFSIPQTLIAYSYFLNVLARKYRARLASYSGRPVASVSTARVFASFNSREHIHVRLSDEQVKRCEKLFQEVASNVRTKRNLFELTVLDVWIGIDVYESYLRDHAEPTVLMSDPRLRTLLRRALAILVFWTDYFLVTDVAAVVVSHDVYVEYDILCKIAYLNCVPVYLPSARGISFADRPHATYAHMQEYKKEFGMLPREVQNEGIGWAKKQLDRRLSGEVGVDMPYSTKSAFRRSTSSDPVLRKSNKTKVLIATHCFYDNPHGFGGMLFLDFFEWLQFLGKVAERTDYDWYIKVHPDPLPGTLRVVEQFCRQFPQITPLPPEAAHPQLVEEGIEFVLTCYGTVSVEYPLMGVPVITAAFNPTSSFDFNWNPKSITEYEAYLLDLNNLRKPIDVESVYACYYMHNDHWYVDDLIFPSHREFTRTATDREQLGSAAYGKFLDSFSTERHREIIDRMDEFINTVKAGASQKILRKKLAKTEKISE